MSGQQPPNFGPGPDQGPQFRPQPQHPHGPGAPGGPPAPQFQAGGPNGPFTQTAPVKAKKSKARLVAAIGIPIAFMAGCGIAGSANSGTNTTAAGTTVTVTATAPGAAVTVTAPAAAPVTVTAAAAPVTQAPPPASTPPAASVVSDGQHLVGSDIKPGRYRTKLPVEEVGGIGLCYAETSNGKGDIMEQEVSNSGKTIITVGENAEIFESSGCGEWEQV